MLNRAADLMYGFLLPLRRDVTRFIVVLRSQAMPAGCGPPDRGVGEHRSDQASCVGQFWLAAAVCIQPSRGRWQWIHN